MCNTVTLKKSTRDEIKILFFPVTLVMKKFREKLGKKREFWNNKYITQFSGRNEHIGRGYFTLSELKIK